MGGWFKFATIKLLNRDITRLQASVLTEEKASMGPDVSVICIWKSLHPPNLSAKHLTLVMPPSHRSSVQNWRVIWGVYQHVHGSIIDFHWIHSGGSYSDHGARWAMLTNVYQEGTLQVIPSIYAVKKPLTRQVMIWMRSCDPSWKSPLHVQEASLALFSPNKSAFGGTLIRSRKRLPLTRPLAWRTRTRARPAHFSQLAMLNTMWRPFADGAKPHAQLH